MIFSSGTPAAKTFHHGVHPEELKELSCRVPSRTLPLPDEVFIPLQQHIGAACEALVKKGDRVKTGQKIGDSPAFISSPVHASITGKVLAVAAFPHPLGSKVPMVHIRRDGEEVWDLLPRPDDWRTAPAKDLQHLIREAGSVIEKYLKLLPM